MQPVSSKARSLLRKARAEDGAALVEFALVFPLMLLFVAVIFESGRLLLGYQAAVEGVRDATRYLARSAPVDICLEPAGTLQPYTARLTEIVEGGTGGVRIFPARVRITEVTPSLACMPGVYRTSPAPIATVSAEIAIDLPLGGLFGLFGERLGGVNAHVSDSARIFGS